MIKSKLLALTSIALVGSMLAGCSGFPSSTQLTSDISAIEKQVQADANLVCGFIPTVATIASFIPGVGVIATDAASIAESICAAVAKAPPVAVASARRRTVGIPGAAPVNVATVIVPGIGPVPIAGKYTR